MTLAEQLTRIAAVEGGSMFMGKPDRWWADPHWRCENLHVSTSFLRTEASGGKCLACRGEIWLTFPEDNDGLLIPAARTWVWSKAKTPDWMW